MTPTLTIPHCQPTFVYLYRFAPAARYFRPLTAVLAPSPTTLARLLSAYRPLTTRTYWVPATRSHQVLVAGLGVTALRRLAFCLASPRIASPYLTLPWLVFLGWSTAGPRSSHIHVALPAAPWTSSPAQVVLCIFLSHTASTLSFFLFASLVTSCHPVSSRLSPQRQTTLLFVSSPSPYPVRSHISLHGSWNRRPRSESLPPSRLRPHLNPLSRFFLFFLTLLRPRLLTPILPRPMPTMTIIK